VHKHERPQPEARGVVDDQRQDHPTAPAAVSIHDKMTSPDPMEIARSLRLLFGSGMVVELRILNVADNPKYPAFTVFAYFGHDHLDEMAKVAMDRARKVNGCCVTINPVLPDLLARRQSSGQQPKHPMTEDEIASGIAGEKGHDASWWTASVWTRVRRYQFFGTLSAVLSEHQLIDDPIIRL
jgi:hypothetical protein